MSSFAKVSFIGYVLFFTSNLAVVKTQQYTRSELIIGM